MLHPIGAESIMPVFNEFSQQLPGPRYPGRAMAYPNNRLSHKKELYYILCIVAVVIILLFSFFAPGGYLDLRKARQDNVEKKKRIEDLERENLERRKTIKDLRTSKDALEREARKKGYGRKDEIVQQLPQEPEK